MENYDYRQAVTADTLQWLRDNAPEDADDARDECELAVTGNADGSYTFCRDEAADYARGFIFGDEWEDFTTWLADAGRSIGEAMEDPETLDVLVRLFVFDDAWSDALDAPAF